MGLVRHLFRSKTADAELDLPPAPWGRAPPDVTPAAGSAPAPTPPSAPRSAPTRPPEPTPASTPEQIPVSELSETPSATIYVIRDAAGIAVDLSCESVDPEHPET